MRRAGLTPATATTQSARVQVGDIVDGRYRLLDVLGEGAAGKVFRCEDLGRGNSFVALKLLHAKDPRVFQCLPPGPTGRMYTHRTL